MAGREFRVIVAGAGVSGLFMAETLKRAGTITTAGEAEQFPAAEE